MAMDKRKKIERQEWDFPMLIRILKSVWMAAFSVLKIALGGVATVLLVMVVCCFVLVGAAGDYLQDDIIPGISFNEEDFSLDQTSFIYNVDPDDGQIKLYQQIYTDTDRQWADIDEIPEDLIHAAIAIEDKRFYEHQGVDWITTVKACANMFFGSSSTFGGSTITQQLIKNLTGDDSVTVQRKVEEIFRAQKFEEGNDKDVIMEWYLNTIYLGRSKYGVKSAAMHYFGKALSELTTAECASLISITNNPSLYDPYIRPNNNRNRQLDVLWAMLDQEWITREEYDEAKAQEMVFKQGRDDEEEKYTCECGFTDTARNFDRDGDLFYCPQCEAQMDIELDVSSDMYSWFTEMVLDDVAMDLCKLHGEEWNSKTKDKYLTLIKKGGYHIYATVDTEAQRMVDEIYTDLDNVPSTKSAQQLLSAIILIDNRTGDIVAAAGSVGQKEYFDATNHATNDDPKQTGSAMKPLAVYAPAFETGKFSPATTLPDLPMTYDGGQFPLNATRRYGVNNSIYQGISESLNTTSVLTLDKIGLEYAFSFAHDKFRLDGLVEEEYTESGYRRTDVGYSPLGLGALTYGVSVRDMAAAYATFPNGGEYREARTYTKVYDSEGNLILDNTQEREQILSERANNYINYCLRGVVTSGNASWHAQLGNTAAAGKTGTTSNDRDRWFCGYTDYYTAAVWCGYKQPEQIRLTGSDTTNPATRMWSKVMKLLHEDVKWRDLYSSYGMGSYSVCIDSGKNASAACSADPRGNRVQSILCYPEHAPSGTCTMHTTVDWCVEGDGAATEFCKLSGATIESHGLIKYTLEQIRNIIRAGNVTGFGDNIIYLVDANGNPSNSFHGIDGDINAGVNAPYKVCTMHTAETVTPPETEPTDPSEPGNPEQPGIPEQPGTPEQPADPGAAEPAE